MPDDARHLREQFAGLLSETPAPAGQRNDREAREVAEFEEGVTLRAEMQVARPAARRRNPARRGQGQPAWVDNG